MANSTSKARLNDTDLLCQVVKQQIIDSAPEKERELEEIWRQYSPIFSLAEDKPGFSIEAGPYGLLIFTNRTMLYIWILGFAAWKALHAYSSLLLILKVSEQSFKAEEIKKIPDQIEVDNAFEGLINELRKLGDIERIEDFKWPASVHFPAYRQDLDIEGKAVYDLVCMAMAYIFLHEVQHIRFLQDGDAPDDPYDEELECDRFARDMLMDRIKTYSRQSGYPLQKVRSKRAMSLALASFLLLELTPTQFWGDSRSHPPISQRIRLVTDFVNLPSDDWFWNYTSCLLLAKLRSEKMLPNNIEFVDEKDLCTKLLQILDT